MLTRIVLGLSFMVAVSAVSANELDHPETARCIHQAAQAFVIPEMPLWVILDVEGGTVGRTSANTNGTYDMGPMQINTIWLDNLAPLGVTRSEVINNRCINIYVGAWVFAQEYFRFNRNTAKAIAHYHSPTPKHQRRYMGLIQKAIKRRLARQQGR